MTLYEIKAEALRLMFVTDSDDIRTGDLDTATAPDRYRPYVAGMVGALNRCFADIEKRRVLPVKRSALELSAAEKSRSAYRFDLLQLCPDFFDVCRVVAEGEYDYNGDAPYFMEGSTLVLRGVDSDADYSLLYYPRITRISEGSDNDAPLAEIPEQIACLIPYFIKGDLYRDDEPNEAGEARNWYESGMAMLEHHRTEKQGRVATVYSQVGT